MRKKKTPPVAGKFRMAPLRDVITQTADMLFEAISKQKPNCDQDELENDIRDLVKKHGGVNSSVEAVTASIENDKPVYSLAGDTLVLAFNALRENKTREALLSFIAASNMPDADILIASIEEMNEEAIKDTELEEGSDAFEPDEVIESGYSDDEESDEELDEESDEEELDEEEVEEDSEEESDEEESEEESDEEESDDEEESEETVEANSSLFSKLDSVLKRKK